ncbi:MAG: hypothetical protein IJ048_13165 [Clostridia bacterium]|nr:hypothetical protein [Clostridia bacterium]
MNETERLRLKPEEALTPLPPQEPALAALAADIEAEYRRRRQERRGLELKWRLNQRFLAGDQYCDLAEGVEEIISRGGDGTGRAVYNMIAPIEETRLSKLGRAQPGLTVRPQTDEAADITAARTATKLLKTAFDTQNMPRLQMEAARWAELCGCAFYKSVWDPAAGLPLGVTGEGRVIREGDIAAAVVPAYEIFPECCWRDGLESQNSLIHARVYTVREIRDRWQVSLPGRRLNIYGAETGLARGDGMFARDETLEDAELVLEYYQRPDEAYPQGRHVTVAGGRVLHMGPLPFRNGECGGRDFPFVQQLCLSAPGCVFGGTVIERLIPLQRDYNAVINRITEHTARMTAGNLLAEQGSLVNEALLDEGFEPGTVIEYRAGSTPPGWLRVSEVPVTLMERLALLRRDFNEISGVSEMARASSVTGQVSSGIALDILREQDDTRIALTGRHIRRAVQQVGRQWLRLLREFAVAPRITRTAGEDAGDMALVIWSGSDLSSDDVAVDTDLDLSNTPAQRRQLALELMNAGLFLDPDTHQLSRENRARLMEIFQFGHWESAVAVDELHRTRARREQLELTGGVMPALMGVDNHALHIAEHTRFALGAEFRRLQQEKPALAQALLLHIEGHRALMGGNP